MSKQLIEQLGGVKAVALTIGTSEGSVFNWRLRDTIPWRHRHAIARMAAERAVDLPDNFWADAA